MYRSKKNQEELEEEEDEEDTATGTFGVRDSSASSDKKTRSSRRLTSSTQSDDGEDEEDAQSQKKKKVRGLRRAGQKFRVFGDDPTETDPSKENVGHKQGITSAFCDPYGEFVFTASYDGTIRRWDAFKGEPKKRYKGAPDRIWSAKLDTTDQFLGAACNDGCVYVWDAVYAQKFCRITTGQTRVYDISFSPAEPTVVATAGMDGKIKLFDCADAYYAYIDKKQKAKENKEVFVDDKTEITEEVCELEGHKDKVYSVRFSPDGAYILSASRDKTARLWDAQTQTEICRFTGHTGAVRRAEFIASNYVLTAGDDGTVRIWKLPSSIMISPPAGASYSSFGSDLGMGDDLNGNLPNGAPNMAGGVAAMQAMMDNANAGGVAAMQAMMDSANAGMLGAGNIGGAQGARGNDDDDDPLPSKMQRAQARGVPDRTIPTVSSTTKRIGAPAMPGVPQGEQKGMGISVSGLAPTQTKPSGPDAEIEKMFGDGGSTTSDETEMDAALPEQELLCGKEAFRFVVNSPVFSVSVSPQIIAAGCQSGEVFIWYADASPLAGQLWSTDEHLADTSSYSGQSGQMGNGFDGNMQDMQNGMQNMQNDMLNMQNGMPNIPNPMGNGMMPGGMGMPNGMQNMPNNRNNMPGGMQNNLPRGAAPNGAQPIPGAIPGV